MYHCDNLPVLQGINSETIDLIATDPPFNKGKDFYATPESLAAGAKFQDRWTWEKDVHEIWTDGIKDDHPAVWKVIKAANDTWGKDMGAYLCFMGVRLLEMHRVLKPTGSLYLHCDPTASHYLKLMLDGIFGRKNFRNEIVWCYTGPSNTKRWFPRKHDVILFYAKDAKAKCPFNYDDVRIPYRKLETGKTSGIFKKAATLSSKGKIPEDYWLEDRDGMTPVGRVERERVGYPTQKPLALYARIIKASSNQGDVVLDPFCGCATTVVAAERLGRRWVGIDLWENAHKTVLDRLQREVLNIPNTHSDRLFSLGDVTYATDPPARTDEQEIAAPSFDVPISLSNPVTKMTQSQMFNRLQVAQATPASDPNKVVCAGCGRALEPDFMQLDHVTPKKDGGSNYIINRVLLCGPCNSKKGSLKTISGMRADNRDWIIDQAAAERALSAARTAGEQALREAIAKEHGQLPFE